MAFLITPAATRSPHRLFRSRALPCFSRGKNFSSTKSTKEHEKTLYTRTPFSHTSFHLSICRNLRDNQKPVFEVRDFRGPEMFSALISTGIRIPARGLSSLDKIHSNHFSTKHTKTARRYETPIKISRRPLCRYNACQISIVSPSRASISSSFPAYLSSR